MIFAVTMSTVLLGMAAITVDLGNALARRGALQTSADLAALSGARALPLGQAAAHAAAVGTLCAAENRVAGWPATMCQPGADWHSDGSAANGEIQFFSEGSAASSTPTRIRVIAPPARVDFGLAQVVVPGEAGQGVDLQARAGARIGTPVGRGLLPFYLTPADLPGAAADPSKPHPGVVCITETPSTVPGCTGASAARGHARVPRRSTGESYALELNIRRGVEARLFAYTISPLVASLPGLNVDCHDPLTLPGALPSVHTHSYVQDINCVHLQRATSETVNSTSDQLEEGFFSQLSGAPGPMLSTCSSQTYSVNGRAMDATDLFDPGNGLLRPGTDAAALKARIMQGLPADTTTRGAITAKAFGCPRFSVLPVVGASFATTSPVVDLDGRYPIIGFAYVWIGSPDQLTASEEESLLPWRLRKGFVWKWDYDAWGWNWKLRGFKAYVIDPSYLPQGAAPDLRLGPWRGPGVTTQVALIPDP